MGLVYIMFGSLFLTYYGGGQVRVNSRWRAQELQLWSIEYDKSTGANKICIGKTGDCVAVASGRNATDLEVLVAEKWNPNNANNYWIINTEDSIRLQRDTRFFWNFQYDNLEWVPLQINIINGLTKARPNPNFRIVPVDDPILDSIEAI